MRVVGHSTTAASGRIGTACRPLDCRAVLALEMPFGRRRWPRRRRSGWRVCAWKSVLHRPAAGGDGWRRTECRSPSTGASFELAVRRLGRRIGYGASVGRRGDGRSLRARVACGEVVDAEDSQPSRPGAIECLPIRPVARIPINVVAAIPAGVEESLEARPYQRLFCAVDGVRDEVDAPLSAHGAADAAVCEVLVKDDEVAGTVASVTASDEFAARSGRCEPGTTRNAPEVASSVSR